jgi:O-succinylbenzoate synthase
MMESPLGVSYAARLAHHLQPDFIHDLDAAWWLKNSPLKYEDGFITEEGALS